MKLKRKIRILVMGFFQVLLGKGGAFHAEEERLLRVYYNTAGHRIEKLKTGVVMMIDGRTMHGGLSDRLRGICSVYYWCKLHSIPFYIHFEYPFHLADYLLPASYDWTISDDEISILPPPISRPVMLMLHLLPSKLHKFYLNCLLKQARNKQLHVYSNTNIYDQYYDQSFKDLFTFAPPLKKAVAHQLDLIGRPFIAMVLRFQQLLGDFKEGDYDVLPQGRRITFLFHNQ